jgi:phage-related protein
MRIIALKSCQKEIEAFPLDVREQISDYLALVTIGEILYPPAAKYLGSIVRGLWELRMRSRSGQYRLVFMMRPGHTIYLLHGFKKTTQHIELRTRKTIKERLTQI